MNQVYFSCIQVDEKEVDNFYPVFEQAITTLFPEYTPKVREYFIKKDYDKEWLKSAIAKKDKILFIAKHEDKICGFMIVNKVYGGLSSASWIAVLPEFQSNGIATMLLKKWEDFSIANGAHALQLWTTDRNIDFYQKRGFNLIGTFPKAWFGIDMPLMYKSLRDPTEQNYLKNYLSEKS